MYELQAVRIWNDLPAEIKKLPLNKFKKVLKIASLMVIVINIKVCFFKLSHFCFSFNFSFHLKFL